jgi:hypothetical protein
MRQSTSRLSLKPASRRPSRIVRWLALGIAAGGGGCAHVYVDEQGRTNVIGLAWITVSPPSQTAGPASKQRETYVGYLNVNDAWEARTISALEFHEDLVCRLAART